MRLRRTAHLHEFIADDGRRFVVRLNVGMAVGVVQSGPASERIDWREAWGTYRPQSDATAARLVEEFLQRDERRRGIEPANDELMKLTRQPKPKLADVHERQLPIADRA